MREKIIKFLEKKVKEMYIERDLTVTCYLNLGNGFSVVLAWEEGFDTEDECELCLSLRETDSSYFVYDWTIIDEDVSLNENMTKFDLDVDWLLDILSTQEIEPSLSELMAEYLGKYGVA